MKTSSDPSPQSLQQEARRHLVVFGAVALCTLAIVASTLLPLSTALRITAVLTIAVVQASLVAGFLMHLINEKRLIVSSLVLTAIFFVALIFLPILSDLDHTSHFFHR